MVERYVRKYKEEENSLSQLDDPTLVDQIYNYFYNNPFPLDHMGVHKFAETIGISICAAQTKESNRTRFSLMIRTYLMPCWVGTFVRWVIPSPSSYLKISASEEKGRAKIKAIAIKIEYNMNSF